MAVERGGRHVPSASPFFVTTGNVNVATERFIRQRPFNCFSFNAGLISIRKHTQSSQKKGEPFAALPSKNFLAEKIRLENDA
jgi:hypothetical protein